MSEQGMRDPWNNGDWLNTRVRFLLDWLDLPPETLADLLEQVAEKSHLTWCLFSAHPERFRGRLAEVVAGKFVPCAESHAGQSLADRWLLQGVAPPNVYVGTTVTTQAEADERIPALLSIPARVRVLWVSPREPLDLTLAHPTQQFDERECLDGIGWVVCEGGDSPMHPEWVRSLRDQCEGAGVPFWFSGWGEWRPGLPEDCGMDQRLVEVQSVHARSCGRLRDILLNAGSSSHPMARVGKDKAGRLLDGRTWGGVPS